MVRPGMGSEALAAAHTGVAGCREQIKIAIAGLHALDKELESLDRKLDTAQADMSFVAVCLRSVSGDIKSQCTLSFARQELGLVGRLVRNNQR